MRKKPVNLLILVMVILLTALLARFIGGSDYLVSSIHAGLGGYPYYPYPYPYKGTWKPTGPLNKARTNHTASGLANGGVLAAGGSGATGALNSGELYNPATGNWTPTNGTLNTARYYHAAARLANGWVLVAGGRGASSAYYLNSAELYNPATDAWTTTVHPLNTARIIHTATQLANGKVLVAGGSGATGSLNSAELYDPATDAWTTTAQPLNTTRAYHTATLLTNGQVLVAGGYSGTMLNSAELYDPAKGTWTPTGPLNAARGFHTATLLSTGKVLAAGGNGAGGILNSAELYQSLGQPPLPLLLLDD
jgi:hypothetical protein